MFQLVLWRSASSLGKNAEGKQDEPGFAGEDKAVRGTRGADPELVQIAPQVTSGGKPQAASAPHLHDDGSPVLVRELGQEVGDRAVARC